MNLVRLAQMAQVIGQMKVILNTSSLARHSKDDVNALKKKLKWLEDLFLTESLALSETPEEFISIPSCSPVGRVNVNADGAVTVSAPADSLIMLGSTDAVAIASVTNEPEAVELPPPSKEDPELRKRLLEEKKKLAAKKKKTG